MTTDRTEVCVVGGGIIGLAVAFELSRRGRAVTVLEAARIGEQAAAGAAAGMLAPASEADFAEPLLTRLALASHALYPRFVGEVERASGQAVGFDRTGTLFVALHSDHLALLDHLQAFQRDRGLEAVRVTAAELRAREPALSPRVAGGVELRDDCQVDPRRLLAALRAALESRGAPVIERAPARTVIPEAGGYAVCYEQGGEARTLRAQRVVIAAGAWSKQIQSPLSPLPLLPLPLRPVKGQLLRLRGERLIHHVVRTPDVYIVPRADGELIVGATMEEQGFDQRPTAGAVLDLLREGWRVLPGIYELELAEVSVGLRPALRDHLPAIGETESAGLYVAIGHFRNGVELAPITARLLAGLICDGAVDPLLEGVSPRRFGRVEATP